MSTFDGIVSEFPDIRIDHFRQRPGTRPALAFFLSHVHSDHLVGLESCRGFIYCSPATREIVLRLEKRFHRINFANGLLEVRKQGYARLATQLKPLPLDTPVEIELSLNNKIRVTLLDANHCVGAVMFLIEGHGKTILYTGDIRSEQWWVDSLRRHPVMIPYVAEGHCDGLRRIDTIYLDTTFASKTDMYREFPSKADGIAELLQKVAPFPDDTIYYFDSWTFGYEDVWQALANFLHTRIHVDHYKYNLYSSLVKSKEPRAAEAFKLILTHCGNHPQEGCLTSRPERARIHSCEKGTSCEIFQQKFVRITPIISRHRGQDIAELGIGGGHGDVSNARFQLELGDQAFFQRLIFLCESQLSDQPTVQVDVIQLLARAQADAKQTIILDGEDYDYRDPESLTIKDFVISLARKVQRERQHSGVPQSSETTARITFPYSRHSSYSELCLLIRAFKPRDVFPCTVDETRWGTSRSMAHLFGHLYPAAAPLVCAHDQMMLRKRFEGKHLSSPVSDIHTPAPISKRGLKHASSSPPTPKRSRREQTVDRESATQEDEIRGGLHLTLRSHPEDVEMALRYEMYRSAEAAIDTGWHDMNLVAMQDHTESDREL